MGTNAIDDLAGCGVMRMLQRNGSLREMLISGCNKAFDTPSAGFEAAMMSNSSMWSLDEGWCGR